MIHFLKITVSQLLEIIDRCHLFIFIIIIYLIYILYLLRNTFIIWNGNILLYIIYRFFKTHYCISWYWNLFNSYWLDTKALSINKCRCRCRCKWILPTTGWRRDHNTHMARGFSVLHHVFAREQCILCSGLRQKSYLTLLYVTPSCYTLELSRTALLGCRLAASLPRVFARLLVGNYHHHDLALKVFALV